MSGTGPGSRPPRPSSARPRSTAPRPAPKGRPQAPRTRRKIAGERPQQRVSPFRRLGEATVGRLRRSTDSGPGKAAASRKPSRSLTRTAVLWLSASVLVLAIAIAFAAAAGLHAWNASRDATNLDRAQSQATSAAAKAAQTILSYRYTDIADDLQTARGTMTPAYAAKVQNIEKPLTSLARQRKLVVQAQVRNLAPLPCGDQCSTDRVDVLVFADQVRTSAGKALATEGSRSVFTMTRTDGRWLVSMVTTR